MLGSLVSWAGFVLCFALLFRVAFTVMALGGSCASGGPYLIEVECPESVVMFAPLSIFGGLFFAAVSLLFAQGFGTPLLVWAWPILFVGLSVPFFAAGAGSIGSILVGVMFLVMGVAPLWALVRLPNPWVLLLGGRNAAGRPFAQAGETVAMRLIGRRRGALTDPVDPTIGDWMLSLGALAIACVAGLAGSAWLWALASQPTLR